MTEAIIALCSVYLVRLGPWAQSDIEKKILLSFNITYHPVFDDIHLIVMALKSQLTLMNINEGL